MNLTGCGIRVTETHQSGQSTFLYFLFLFSPYWGSVFLYVLSKDLFYVGIHDFLLHYLYDPEQLKLSFKDLSHCEIDTYPSCLLLFSPFDTVGGLVTNCRHCGVGQRIIMFLFLFESWVSLKSTALEDLLPQFFLFNRKNYIFKIVSIGKSCSCIITLLVPG